MDNVINFTITNAESKTETAKSEYVKKIEKLGLIFFPQGAKGGKFSVDNEKVSEWLDKRTLSGEKMTAEEEEKIDSLITGLFLQNISNLNWDNYDYVRRFLDHFCDEKFIEYFKKQVSQAIFPFIDLKFNELIGTLPAVPAIKV